MAPDDDSYTSFPVDFDDDEDEFLRAWDEAEAGALDLLRRSLAEVVGEDPPRLTALGRWGLPRALAWAWNGDFDAGGEE
jgi:hypothetical protein